jgi:hypothetical protein
MANISSYKFNNYTFFIDENNNFGWKINEEIKIVETDMLFSNYIYCAKIERNIISVYCTERYIIEDYNESVFHTIEGDQYIDEWSGDIFIINKDENKILQHYYPKFINFVRRPAKYISFKGDNYIKIYNFSELFVMDENAKTFTFLYAYYKDKHLFHSMVTVPITIIRTSKNNFINRPRTRLLVEVQKKIADECYQKIKNISNFNYETDSLLGITPFKSITSPSFFVHSNIINEDNLLKIELTNKFYKLTCEFPIELENRIKIDI